MWAGVEVWEGVEAMRREEVQGSVQGAEVERCMQRCSGMRTLELCVSSCAELALSCFSRRRTWSAVGLRLRLRLRLGLGSGSVATPLTTPLATPPCLRL